MPVVPVVLADKVVQVGKVVQVELVVIQHILEHLEVISIGKWVFIHLNTNLTVHPEVILHTTNIKEVIIKLVTHKKEVIHILVLADR